MNGLFEKKPKQGWSSPYIWALPLSVFIHLLLLIAEVSYMPEPYLMNLEKDVPIEIADVPKELLEVPAEAKPDKRKEPQIAETEDVKNREKDPNATILSDHDQTVSEQMKAKQVDDFREGEGTGLKMSQKEGMAGATPEGEKDRPDAMSKVEVQDGVGTEDKKDKLGIKRDWKTLSLTDLSVNGDGSPSAASDDYLPDMAEGNRTILSTREFQYFSYYHRIKELLRQYWKPAIERKIALLWVKGKYIRQQEMTTRLLILLDKQGTLTKISRLGSSGIRDIDTAAEEAFVKAAPFPNPPQGIIDPDGFVRIRWDFILKAENAPTIHPDVAALVWVGFDDNRSIRASGASAALPIWAELAGSMGWRLSGREFAQPPGVRLAELCEESGHVAAFGCLQRVQDYIIEGHPGATPCPLHEGAGGAARGLMERLKSSFGL